MRTNKIKNVHDAEKFMRYLPHVPQLIFRLGCATGLRVSDLISLTADKLSIKEPTIREQKTGKAKRFYIPAKLRQELLDHYALTGINQYVFGSSKSKTGHITRQAVYKAFKKASASAGINYNVATHTMRKTYSARLKATGKSLEYIKRKLNHTNIADTALYLIQEE